MFVRQVSRPAQISRPAAQGVTREPTDAPAVLDQAVETVFVPLPRRWPRLQVSGLPLGNRSAVTREILILFCLI